MSVVIKKSTIIMTRGDTLQANIIITDDEGTEYVPTEGDQIRFAVKKNYNDELPLIIKEIPYDTLLLRVESSETKTLEQPGDYVYDIQITLTDGTVNTFISGKLKLIEEVE